MLFFCFLFRFVFWPRISVLTARPYHTIRKGLSYVNCFFAFFKKSFRYAKRHGIIDALPMVKVNAKQMADFRTACSAFGRLGKGKRKTMTPAAIDQRRQAAKQSAISRGKRVKRKLLRVKGKSLVKGNYLVKGNSPSPAPGFAPPTPPNRKAH
jgi:hypothetical protein